MSVMVPGYGFAPKNASYIPDTWNPRGSIEGRLDKDTNVSVLLEPLADLPKVNPPSFAGEAPPHTPEEAKLRNDRWQAIAKTQEETRRRVDETRARPLQGVP